MFSRNRMDRITYHEAKGDFAGGYEVYAHNVDTQQSITIHCQQLVIATDEISAAKLIEQVKPFTSTSNSAGENMLSSRVTPIAVAKEATGRG